jgi:nitrile hydratase accessory protein
MSDPDRDIADLDSLPRKNGELVFQAPWEGRAFGMAAVLTKQAGFDWNAFRHELVAEIAARPDAPYYTSWLAALERLLLGRGALSEAEIDRRQAEYRSLERQDVF